MLTVNYPNWITVFASNFWKFISILKMLSYYLRGYSYFTIMTVSINQWHAGIGLFYGKVYVSVKVFNINICLSLVCQNLFSLVYCFYLFLFCFIHNKTKKE